MLKKMPRASKFLYQHLTFYMLGPLLLSFWPCRFLEICLTQLPCRAIISSACIWLLWLVGTKNKINHDQLLRLEYRCMTKREQAYNGKLFLVCRICLEKLSTSLSTAVSFIVLNCLFDQIRCWPFSAWSLKSAQWGNLVYQLHVHVV